MKAIIYVAYNAADEYGYGDDEEAAITNLDENHNPTVGIPSRVIRLEVTLPGFSVLTATVNAESLSEGKDISAVVSMG